MRKVLENRALLDEERMKKLEEELKDARNQAEEADKGGGRTHPTLCLFAELGTQQCFCFATATP